MALELKQASKQVGADVHIQPTDLRLSDTGFNVLLGTTLAGKTTLMRLMAGLEPPTAGEVWFRGRNVTHIPVQRRNVSMVYQQFINYPNLSVFENIASSLRVTRTAASEVKRRVGEVAELLKLTPMLERRPSELSGGQQQRTALARALVKAADLVLLDEPLANLDFKLREELREELPKLFAGRECTVVYATTEPVEALLLAGHTATIHAGRVTQFGPTAEVYRAPRDLVTAQVFADPPMNTAAVVKSGSTMAIGSHVSWACDSRALALPDGEYVLGIRPHHLTPSRASESSVELSGRVLVTELSGSESTIHAQFDDAAYGGVAWVSQSHGIHPLEVGASARLFADSTQCLYFSADGQLVCG